MNVLLTGGTGLIGRHLIPRLLELGHHVTVSTRSPEKAKSRFDSRVTLWRDFEHQANLNGIDAVINLAGEPIADKRWEQIACEAQSDRTRVCLLRTGVVLAPRGGILAKMTPAFKLGLGGPIGSGRQYLAWIHIDDMVNGILWLLDNDLRGPFNMVSPYPVRNEQFAHALGHALNRPAIFRVPAAAIRLLMGESSVLVLGGQRALPKRLEAAGFGFRWYDLEEALADVLK